MNLIKPRIQHRLKKVAIFQRKQNWYINSKRFGGFLIAYTRHLKVDIWTVARSLQTQRTHKLGSKDHFLSMGNVIYETKLATLI